ncbi:DUF305 domain-containing protein, partial [Pseudarthrobacter sp. CC12]|uniref:DUF305 domain-containing protein n=1 Tax=Pseudarthrobacter sp. CC12 TaxID=3029193 RepID=UPI00326386F2
RGHAQHPSTSTSSLGQGVNKTGGSPMIPHHSRAILVCQESNITDPEIIDLCHSIVTSQQDEITQMQSILDRYEAD